MQAEWGPVLAAEILMVMMFILACWMMTSSDVQKRMIALEDRVDDLLKQLEEDGTKARRDNQRLKKTVNALAYFDSESESDRKE